MNIEIRENELILNGALVAVFAEGSPHKATVQSLISASIAQSGGTMHVNGVCVAGALDQLLKNEAA